MNRFCFFPFALIAGIFGMTLAGRASAVSPVEQMQSFSAFKEVNLQKLAEGEILTERGPLMKFRRGIYGESCFVVMKSPAAVSAFIQNSKPQTGEDQGVFFHEDMSVPAMEEDFKALDLTIDRFPVRRLLKKTQEMSGDKSDYSMSKAEAATMAAAMKGAAKPSDAARAAWMRLLKGRALEFQKGFLTKLGSYDAADPEVNPVQDMKSLLAELPGLSKELQPVLSICGLGESEVKPSADNMPTQYWEMINWDLQATFVLAAVFNKDLGDGRYQLLDCQYFSTGIFHVSMCFFELWPVTVNGREATLVWRADLLSAPSLEVTRGIERVAYGKIMMVEIKKSIKNFQKDILKTK